MSPEVLGRATASIQRHADEDQILVGFDTSDDAGVVRLENGTCLVQTVDFLTPIADDPFTYGAIAAANALSDVYAMGGSPVSALNILCWPQDQLEESVLTAILEGGLSKVREAGAVLLGGHSVRDAELKYGLAVTGTIDSHAIWTHGGAQPGDLLVLTKALGTGIVSTALKRDSCPAATWSEAQESMLNLNRDSANALRQRAVHAATDVTGFGLLGHGLEMARASNVHIAFDAGALPEIGDARALAAAGCVTGGAKTNHAFVQGELETGSLEGTDLALALDPQTSGGLLVSPPPADAEAFAREAGAHVVGSVQAGGAQVSLTR